MIVYRVQHSETGEGPYCNNLIIDGKRFDLLDYCDNMNSWNSPDPERDAMLANNYARRYDRQFRVPSYAKFGFTTVEQMKKWFGSSGLCKLIHWAKFEVVVKDVNDDCVIVGESQCMIYQDAFDNGKYVGKWLPKEMRSDNAIA